jgi:DNA helicase IV
VIMTTVWKGLWRERRVIFCTPQTLSNDLEDGTCDPASIVCIVIDEAHKGGSKNFAYAQAVSPCLFNTIMPMSLQQFLLYSRTFLEPSPWFTPLFSNPSLFVTLVRSTRYGGSPVTSVC